MAYSIKYLEANREIINLKRREKYSSDARKAYYQQKKHEISQKGRRDVKQCPICQIDYRRVYLRKHMTSRHKLGDAELPAGLCDAIIHD